MFLLMVMLLLLLLMLYVVTMMVVVLLSCSFFFLFLNSTGSTFFLAWIVFVVKPMKTGPCCNRPYTKIRTRTHAHNEIETFDRRYDSIGWKSIPLFTQKKNNSQYQMKSFQSFRWHNNLFAADSCSSQTATIRIPLVLCMCQCVFFCLLLLWRVCSLDVKTSWSACLLSQVVLVFFSYSSTERLQASLSKFYAIFLLLLLLLFNSWLLWLHVGLYI